MKHKCRPADDENLLRELQSSSAADDELAKYAKALGHPARVRILRILAEQTGCICGDVVAELPLAQSTVSQHLKVLKEAGLIQGEIDGPRVRYCIASLALDRLKALVKEF